MGPGCSASIMQRLARPSKHGTHSCHQPGSMTEPTISTIVKQFLLVVLFGHRSRGPPLSGPPSAPQSCLCVLVNPRCVFRVFADAVVDPL